MNLMKNSKISLLELKLLTQLGFQINIFETFYFVFRRIILKTSLRRKRQDSWWFETSRDWRNWGRRIWSVIRIPFGLARIPDWYEYCDFSTADAVTAAEHSNCRDEFASKIISRWKPSKVGALIFLHSYIVPLFLHSLLVNVPNSYCV